MRIQLKVSRHPSGRFTLEQRNEGEAGFSDVRELTLRANDDPAQFYRAVAARLAGFHSEGHQVDYQDANY